MVVFKFWSCDKESSESQRAPGSTALVTVAWLSSCSGFSSNTDIYIYCRGISPAIKHILMTPGSPNQPSIPESRTCERVKVRDCPHSKRCRRYHRLICGYMPRFSVKHKSGELLCKYTMYDFFKLHLYSSLKA